MPERPLNPLFELTLARLRELWREPEAMFWTFGFPLLLSLALGIAFRNKAPEDVHVSIVGTPAAAEELRAVLDKPGFHAEVMTTQASEEALRKGKVDVEVTPAEGTATYRFDPARTESRVARLAVDDALQRSRGRPDTLASTDVPIERPGSRYIDFLVPGLIGLNILSSSMWGAGYTIVYARKRKLLKRLAATPMRRSHYLLSHVLARLVFLVLEVSVVLAFAALVFGVTVQGSALALALVVLTGGISFMGIGLLIAARPTSTEAASGWMNLVQMPMWILGGSFFSYERFPEVTLPFIRLLPLTAFNDAFRAVLNEGAGLLQIGPELAVLGVWGGVSLFVALKIFRWF